MSSVPALESAGILSVKCWLGKLLGGGSKLGNLLT